MHRKKLLIEYWMNNGKQNGVKKRFYFLCFNITTYNLDNMIWLHDYCSIVSVFFLIIGGIGLQLNEMLEEKLRPYVEEIDNGELSRPIIIQQAKDQKVSIYLFPDPEIWIMLLYIGCNV